MKELTGWRRYGPSYFDDVIHVYPVGDLREHAMSLTCWCNPTYDPNNDVLLHHSMDLREQYEEGRLKS
jgi:hypothetical protein